MDDRIGVSDRSKWSNTRRKHRPIAAFTVQEEFGYGAMVAAYNENSDIAPRSTAPGNDRPPDGAQSSLTPKVWARCLHHGSRDDGPRQRHGDSKSYNIAYQIRQATGGSTDAAGMHRQRSGIPSFSLSVPGRNMHNTMTIIRKTDWEATLKLAYAVLATLDKKVLKRDE